MKTIRSRLGYKLFISYVIVILVGMATIGLIANLATPRAYTRHLLYMEQQLGEFGMGQGQGMGQGMGQGKGMMADFYHNFQTSFNESLVIAVLTASATALLVSYFFSRGILLPVQVMMKASQRIAEGHYDERVALHGGDELHQLAQSFNTMAQQLQQVEDMRRRLIGDVAHELRTPLTGIKGATEALIDGVLPASVQTYSQIHAEAQRLSRLVDDLQELSRVESRAFSLDLHPVDSAALVKTVYKRMQPQFEEKGVSLTLNLPPTPLIVLADEGRALQVLTNLLGNALQYTPAAGAVSISLQASAGFAQFSIQDTGLGIPPQALRHIFDRFYRVDKSRSRTHGGSGIGLTIAMHLVEAQGGTLWAQSAGENQGSLFTFTLPLHH